MFEWIIKISIASVLFTLASFILPKGNIQKASLTALSFLFLAIIMVPLKNITSELINKKLTLEYEKNQLISQNYVVSQRQAELQKIGPTDEQIRAFYEANKASLVWTDMMKIFAIAVPKGSNPEQAKLTANDFRNKIVDKKLTSEQALVQSQKPDAGYQAIEGVIQKNEAYAMQLGIPLQTLLTMFNQKEGFVSDIQETESDYRVFVLKKKYEAKMLSISDVVQPETTMTVYEYIRQNLANQMQSLYLQNAANEIAKSLNTPENVEYKKTGDALTKILNWGE